MRSISILILALLFSTTSQAQWWGNKSVKGNGKMTTETRTTSDYDGIRCAGSMDFILVAGEEGKITLEGEENLLKHIITEIKNGQLVVKVEKGKNIKPSWGKDLKITIPFREIEKVSLAGSGDLWNKDTIKSDELDVSLAGSGDVVLDIQTNEVSGSIAGSGDLTLKGDTDSLDASVAGSGDFHGFELESKNTVVSVAGSGDAKVVSRVSLKARVAGSGDIEYRGNPDKEDTKVSGSGSISN
ncbi:MAG: DUF2807 domain-containing protein [Bacteroidia bacterium]|nr:DUF2807 domain-containing protein [Bacteroidia bacterium]MBT8269310.1 DUF2807 domain-containing protein [Bacteroidia bacterium]NNF82749.1 DUF2807 domain-containing protein [Flavobacteriaceae bacterium]NNK69356.1 DUF2807 domain-containing protein [Flavobacteriaceae bacterium]NNL79343.1 DUF2807 domain-containing protein [Flavobacteriaceae bacterium]